jgi:hypothetical protein
MISTALLINEKQLRHRPQLRGCVRNGWFYALGGYGSGILAMPPATPVALTTLPLAIKSGCSPRLRLEADEKTAFATKISQAVKKEKA